MRLRSGSLGRERSLGRDLKAYHRDLVERTGPIDSQLAQLVELVDALRHRAADTDDALAKLLAAGETLDAAADGLRTMTAPAALHGLHAEYEGNLERAMRGVVIAARGCGIAIGRGRAPAGDEAFAYWKRGHHNILHARLRMQELVDALLAWRPGMTAKATVGARLGRT